MRFVRAVFAIPGDPLTRTGGYIYDRRVMQLLPACSIDISLLRLPAAFPFPGEADLKETQRLLSRVPPEDVLLIDGLAWGAVPPAMLQSVRAQIIALCHHPLGLEAGLPAWQSTALIANEIETLAAATHVIVTSATTAETLVREFSVPRAKITIAEPGTDTAPRARGSGGAPVLLAVGSIVPRKGYDVLVDALALLADMDWRLVIAGSPDRAPDFAAMLRQRISAAGLDARINLAGELEDCELACAYGSADIFVSASHYEGFGMVLTEALARGLPIVTTTGGAAASTVPDEASLKVPPGDAPALAQAIRTLLTDQTLRGQLAESAWTAAATLPRWEDTARTIAGVIRAVSAGVHPEARI